MKPLLVLLCLFGLSLVATAMLWGTLNFAFSGKAALAGMLLFTASAHFVFTRGMTMMVPAFIPYKKQIVHLTGVLEIAGAAALFISRISIVTGWLLIAFFIVLLPANIYAAIHHIDYQKGSYNGKGLSYLWFRIPLQLFFIFWTYCWVILG
ncbi:hypothetical protein GR160_07830 [Flavobacterium sp. Sd200]|uniref:DoxX family protein n=1 Tax=Flavobacterium sp. Sd200 TaxID=2692211 RepID=UPI00136A7298|nr:hypothetical protein [Flavobacterium sp. Sd200]MXN91138.1 hypothetical protein [Flavobacterium sp. Sd200]